MNMYPSTQSKPHPSPSNPLPPPPPPPHHKPISYATPPAPSYSHLQNHDVRSHLPQLRNSQWTAPPYHSSTITHNLPPHPHHPPSLPHPSPKDPSQQTQIPQVDPQPPPPPPPPPPHHYTHHINVVAPQSRQLPPPHQYMYLHPQVVAPVAHVPIGAAHYAHLPPSIWSPTHAQFHQSPPPQHHPRPIHTPSQAPHHISVHASTHSPSLHLHHVQQAHHPQQVYPHTLSTPPMPHHELHPQTLYQPHPVTYQYPHLQSTTSSQLAKATVPLPQTTPPAMSCQEPAPVSSAYPPKSSGTGASGKRNGTFPTQAGAKAEGKEEEPQYRSFERNTQSAANRTLAAEKIAVESPQKPENGRSSLKEENENRVSSQEQGTSGSPRQRNQQLTGQTPRKPRKPYTKTKSREVWTQEEHARFVQALQLYDRDWKKIEAYIGTKTVLQIRSHAQKHFGKVTKYQTGEYIPPPRPKKRAVLPYPRSRSMTVAKVSSNSGTGSDSGGCSDIGTVSNGAIKNGSATNGNGSPTASGLHSSSPSGDQGIKLQNGSAVRPGSRPQVHHQRSREGLKAMNEEPRPMEGANHPYYDCASARSYQDRGSQRARALPPLNAMENSRGAPLPPWNGVQSVSGNSSQYHARSILCSSATAKAQDRGHPSYGRLDAREEATQIGTGKDSLNPGMRPHLSTKELPDRTITSEPLLTSDQDRSALRSVESRHAEVVRAEDGGRVSGPNNSLLVLSNCVDMMARNNDPRPPASGLATTAAARRAHRAKVIRGRKPPLQPSSRYSEGELVFENRDGRGSVVTNRGGNKGTHDSLEAAQGAEGLPRAASGHENSVSQAQQQNDRGRSPPAAQDDGMRGGGHDPQRSSAGSGSNSDDAIAGFSGSDRPSGMSSGGSGSGGSVESSDAGDEDPKSSNDGSGDDTNRQTSPSTRDSSPADPNSSGSRENTPNEIGDGNQTNAELGKVEMAEREQAPNGSHEERATGSEKQDCNIKDVRGSCKANSIANLCSEVPSSGDKLRDETTEANGKKRPRSPVTGAGGLATEGEAEDEEVRQRLKRKCHGIDGIVHMTSVELGGQGREARNEKLCGEGSAG